MLQNSILLESMWSTSVEETQHIGYGDTSVEDIPSNEDVGAMVKSQLAILVQQYFYIIV
jgi:hypothetical protein